MCGAFSGVTKNYGKRGNIILGLQSKGQLFWFQHRRDEKLTKKNISAD